MCLVVAPGHMRIYTAGYDILVMKWLQKSHSGRLHSPYMLKTYEVGKRYEAKFSYRHNCCLEVHAGIHSFYDFKSAHARVSAHYDFKSAHARVSAQKELHYAIIPKGAEFIVGTRGEVVSTVLLLLPRKPKVIGRAIFGAHTSVRRLRHEPFRRPSDVLV